MIADAFESLRISIELFTYSAILYVFLALLVKGRGAIAGARDAMPETRSNLAWYFLDGLFIAPVVGISVAAVRLLVNRYSLAVFDAVTWERLGPVPTAVPAVFIGAFSSSWRRPLQNTPRVFAASALPHHANPTNTATLARVRSLHPR